MITEVGSSRLPGGEVASGGAAGTGGALQELGEEFRLAGRVSGADLVHRGVHPRVQAEQLGPALSQGPDDDRAAIGRAGVALAHDPAAELDWTVVRPPRLTNGPVTGAYRTAYGRNIKGGLTVSRADVAHLMLATLGRPETIKQVIGIAR